jgi:hypothetical protein
MVQTNLFIEWIRLLASISLVLKVIEQNLWKAN